MPELPEVEITARRLDSALRGARVESALAPGINALKTFDPPLSALVGREVVGVGRRGKQLLVHIEGELALLITISNTHAVGACHTGVIEWLNEVHPRLARQWLLPVCAETWDGYLNDINGGHVTPAVARQ